MGIRILPMLKALIITTLAKNDNAGCDACFLLIVGSGGGVTRFSQSTCIEPVILGMKVQGVALEPSYSIFSIL